MAKKAAKKAAKTSTKKVAKKPTKKPSKKRARIDVGDSEDSGFDSGGFGPHGGGPGN